MTAEQAAMLKRLAEAAYELEAFQPNLTRAEAELRIAMLIAKLKLLEGATAYALRGTCPNAGSGASPRIRSWRYCKLGNHRCQSIVLLLGQSVWRRS